MKFNYTYIIKVRKEDNYYSMFKKRDFFQYSIKPEVEYYILNNIKLGVIIKSDTISER